MSERSERLLSCLGELDDRHIDEAAPPDKVKTQHWKRWGALAAVLALTVGLGGLWLGQLRFGASSGDGAVVPGEPYMYYAGPILPLTLSEEDDSITAQRDVTLDFAPWVPVWVTNEEEVARLPDLTDREREEALDQHNEWFPDGGYYSQSDHIQVSDQYTLTNHSGEDRELTVLYPFTASWEDVFAQESDLTPQLLADGVELDARLHMGNYRGGFGPALGSDQTDVEMNLRDLEDWEGYEALLEDGAYRTASLGAAPDLSQLPVTVYEAVILPAEETEAELRPNLVFSFRVDREKTQLMNSGFDGYSNAEDGTVRMTTDMDCGPGQQFRTVCLILLGEDVEDFQCSVQQGGDPRGGEPVEGCQPPPVRTYTSDLETMLRTALSGQLPPVDGQACELAYRCAADLVYTSLLRGDIERYDQGQLDLLCADAIQTERICYLETDVTVPAGEEVVLDLLFSKKPSMNYVGGSREERGARGFDLMTTLDSNLHFTGQSARLVDHGQIDLLYQNFGFDLEKDIRYAELDPDTAHYELNVLRRPQEEPPA